jgi:hypothetical protein
MRKLFTSLMAVAALCLSLATARAAVNPVNMFGSLGCTNLTVSNSIVMVDMSTMIPYTTMWIAPGGGVVFGVNFFGVEGWLGAGGTLYASNGVVAVGGSVAGLSALTNAAGYAVAGLNDTTNAATKAAANSTNILGASAYSSTTPLQATNGLTPSAFAPANTFATNTGVGIAYAAAQTPAFTSFTNGLSGGTNWSAIAGTNAGRIFAWNGIFEAGPVREVGEFRAYGTAGIGTLFELATLLGSTATSTDPDSTHGSSDTYTTAATVGKTNGFFGNNWYYPGRNGYWSLLVTICTNGAYYFVGASSSPNNDTRWNVSYQHAGFRFDPQTDTCWQFITGAGSANTVTSCGNIGAAAARTNHVFLEWIEDSANSRIVGYIDGLPCATNTANLPTATMGTLVSVGTYVAAGTAIRVERIRHTQDPAGNQQY